MAMRTGYFENPLRNNKAVLDSATLDSADSKYLMRDGKPLVKFYEYRDGGMVVMAGYREGEKADPGGKETTKEAYVNWRKALERYADRIQEELDSK